MDRMHEPATAEKAEPNAPESESLMDCEGRLLVSWKLQWIPLGRLFVDYHEDFLNGEGHGQGAMLAYQRKQKATGRVMASMGKNHYKADLFGVLIGTERDDGGVALCDGGTRYRFLKGLELPDDTLIPVLVNSWDREREVRNYIDLNRERASLSQVDWFVAKVKVGDEQAAKINNVLIDESGHGVSHKKHGWQAVSVIQIASSRGNLRSTIRIIRKLGWLEQPRGRSQGIVGGISRVLLKAGDNFDFDRAQAIWSKHTPNDIYRAAKDYISVGQSRAVAGAVAMHLAELYNNRLRSRRIDMKSVLSKTDSDDETSNEGDDTED